MYVLLYNGGSRLVNEGVSAEFAGTVGLQYILDR